MKKVLTALMAAVIGFGAIGATTLSANAQPPPPPPKWHKPPPPPPPHYRYPRRHDHGSLYFGLGLGLLAAPFLYGTYPRYYRYPSAHVQWCLDHYRSYDPRTNTFRGYDGRRHYCNSPFD